MRLMRKITVLFFVLALSMNGVHGAEGASIWAVDEVEASIDNRLVPVELQGDYQRDITRSEYVKLALNVLYRDGNLVEILQPYPFSDIDGHPYEDDIIEAYNAGLINGYGDGTFKPDKKITRQEIAVLMLNLVKAVNPNQNTEVDSSYNYDEYIALWARAGLDYCYQQKIIKGVGKGKSGFDRILPQGNASREQAMIMVNRLSQSEGVLDRFNLGTIRMTKSDDSGDIVYQSDNINLFAQTYGEALALKLLALSNQGVEINEMEANTAEAELDAEVQLSISRDAKRFILKITTNGTPSEIALETAQDLMTVYGNNIDIRKAFEEETYTWLEEETYTSVIVIGGSDKLIFESVRDDLFGDKVIKSIQFECDIFN